MTKRGRHIRGFTLVETLVSLLVLGLVLAGLSSVLLTGIRLADGQARATTRMANRALVQTFIGARIAEMELVAPRNAPRQLHFLLTESELRFVTRFAAHAPFPGLHEVAFRIGEDGLTVAVAPWQGGQAGTVIDQTLLIPGQTDMRFARHDTVPGQALPDAITLSLADGAGETTAHRWTPGPRIAQSCIIALPLDPGGRMACDGVLQ